LGQNNITIILQDARNSGIPVFLNFYRIPRELQNLENCSQEETAKIEVMSLKVKPQNTNQEMMLFHILAAIQLLCVILQKWNFFTK
jgi:hypothetical protein